jgi:hypothetical protein
VLRRLEPAARDKIYLGYSDAGFMLAGLLRAGFPRLVHGPMPADVRREGGEGAITRVLDWLTGRAVDSLEPNVSGAGPAVAFNITVLSQLLGHAAATRSRQPCADAGGGFGAQLPNRPGILPHHQQSGHAAPGRHPARPLQPGPGE